VGEISLCVLFTGLFAREFLCVRYWFVGESVVCVRYYFVGEILFCVLFTSLCAREFCVC